MQAWGKKVIFSKNLFDLDLWHMYVYCIGIDLSHMQSTYEVDMISHLEDMGWPKNCIPNMTQNIIFSKKSIWPLTLTFDMALELYCSRIEYEMELIHWEDIGSRKCKSRAKCDIFDKSNWSDIFEKSNWPWPLTLTYLYVLWRYWPKG